MNGNKKNNTFMPLFVSFIVFVSVIVLTNDYFDDFEGKNTILVLLVSAQFIYALILHSKRNKELK